MTGTFVLMELNIGKDYLGKDMEKIELKIHFWC